jgi:EAL domain-containing protein (putative c-di-GMP-specific phosphodiesterase class I)
VSWDWNSFEDYILRRIYLVLVTWFAVIMAFLFVLHIVDTLPVIPDSVPDLVWKGVGVAINVLGLALYPLLKTNKAWLRPVALSLVVVNYAITMVTLIFHHHSRGLSLEIYLFSPGFIVILGFFTRRLRLSILASAAMVALFFALYVAQPAAIYSPAQDDFFVNPARYLRLTILTGGTVLVFLLGVLLLNQSINGTLIRRLQGSYEVFRNQALFDQESGLPNGRRLDLDLGDQMETLEGSRDALVLAGFRLDGIGSMTAKLGYDATHRWLALFAQTMRDSLQPWAGRFPSRGADSRVTLYRIEVGVFLFWIRVPRATVLTDDLGPEAFQGLLAGVLSQYPENGDLSFVGAFSIGPNDATTAAQLEANVLNMLHQNTVTDRSQFQPFNATTYARALRKQRIKELLAGPRLPQELAVVFQPKVTADGRRCTGFEALARWRSPTLGSVSPSEFIPLAEDAAAIGTVTDLVLLEVLEMIQRLRDQGAQDFRVSFNLSPVLLGTNFLGRLTEEALQNDLARYLELETTEGVLVRSAENAAQAFVLLTDLGVRFAIDDFGTGYSNLAYLQNFEAGVLKVDKRFIDDLPGSVKSANLVRAILNLARTFGMVSIAEGVETEAQARFLVEAGCDEIQGYYYAKPMEADQALAFFLDRNGLAPR